MATIAWLLTRNAGATAAGFLGALGPLLAHALRTYWRGVSEAEQ